jgi:hypothetical protein
MVGCLCKSVVPLARKEYLCQLACSTDGLRVGVKLALQMQYDDALIQ